MLYFCRDEIRPSHIREYIISHEIRIPISMSWFMSVFFGDESLPSYIGKKFHKP